MIHRSHPSVAITFIVLSSALHLACSAEPTTPPIEEIDAPLDDLRLEIVELDGGSGAYAVRITGRLRDQSRWLAIHERLRVSVSTDGGDREDLLVGPQICPDDGGALYDCHRLTVYMEQERDVRAIAPAVEHLGALLNLIRICSSLSEDCGAPQELFAEVYVSDSLERDRVAARLRWVPGVAGVTAAVWGEPQAGPGLSKRIEALVPAGVGDATVNDGTLQIVPGGVVLARTATGEVRASLNIPRNGKLGS